MQLWKLFTLVGQRHFVLTEEPVVEHAQHVNRRCMDLGKIYGFR